MMTTAREGSAMPVKIFSKKGSQCMDAILYKTLTRDVSRVLHHPTAISGCDLGDCYNRGAHPPTIMGLRA